MEKYLIILIDSLKKKNILLDEIQKICDRHEVLASSEDASMEEYNSLMERKGQLIEDMNRLDDGFTALYARVSPQLKVSPVDYTDYIRELQKLITEISDKTALIQAKEMRLRSRVERMMELSRSSGTRHVAKSDAARKYYQTMKGTTVTTSIFLDSKKQGGKHDT